MRAFHHRDPGLIGLLGCAPSILRRFYYSIIVDGIHCKPESVNMAFKCHPEGIVLITDAIMALGLKPGQSVLTRYFFKVFDVGFSDGLDVE